MPLPFPVLLAAAAAPLVLAATPDPLAAHRWRERVLLVVAPRADDAALRRQRTLFEAMKADARERDLTLVTAVGTTPEAEALRRRFRLGDGFQVVLVGKDGGAKLTATQPVGRESLVPLIDTMPMRQEEMRRRR